jgi:hypothetical protein
VMKNAWTPSAERGRCNVAFFSTELTGCQDSLDGSPHAKERVSKSWFSPDGR